MATIEEKTVHVSATEIRLYREGAFWAAYEQSAYLITQKKDFKVTKKYVKKLDREVVSIGFPDKTLETLAAFFPIMEKEVNQIVMESAEAMDEEVFENWKKEYAFNSSGPLISSNDQTLADKIKSFDLANSTLLDCANFVAELKKTIT